MTLDWAALILSLIGIFLNANKNINCWPIWILSNIFWVFYCADKDLIPLFILQIVFLGMNIYGWRKWKINKK